MRKVFSFLSFLTVFSFLFFSIAPDFASAMTFRRPLDAVMSPVVSAYADHNTGPGVYRYTCDALSVYDNHRGTDFRAVIDTPVYAAHSGTLYYRYDSCPTWGFLGSTCGGGFGNYVRIDHEAPIDGIGFVTTYAHLKRGTTIGPGTFFCSTLVGRSGSSGNSTGPHLHFEIRKYGYPNDDPYAGPCGNTDSFWTGTTTSVGVPSAVCTG